VVTAQYVAVEPAASHAWSTGTQRTWTSRASCAASWAASCPASLPCSSGRRPGRSTTLRGALWGMWEHLAAAHPVSTVRQPWRYRSNSPSEQKKSEQKNSEQKKSEQKKSEQKKSEQKKSLKIIF